MAEQFSGYGAVPIDFGGIGSIADTYTKARLGAQRERVLSELGTGKLDPATASQKLIAAGLPEEGISLARLAESKSSRSEDRAFRQQEAARHAAESQRDYALREKQFNATIEGQKVPSGFEPNPDDPGALRPRRLGPMDPEYIRQKTEASTPQGSLYDQDTLTALAKQARAGDVSVFTNVGRGVQGAQNLVRLRQEITKQNAAEGITGEQQAAKNAEYFGEKAGQRTLGTRSANIELPAAEFQQMAPLALKASEAVDRTQFPNFNAITNAIQKGTGGEAIVRFNAANNTLVNVYSRAVSPTGVPTDAMRSHAYDLLSTAYSKGQYGAVVDMMQQEIAAARRSPGSVRQQMRENFTGQPSGPAAPATAPQSALPQFKSPAEVQRMIQTKKLQSGDQFRDANGDVRTIP